MLGWPEGSAESQAGFPQLLLRTGTKLEQPSRPISTAPMATLIPRPVGVFVHGVGRNFPCYWWGTPWHSHHLALAWGLAGMGRVGFVRLYLP